MDIYIDESGSFVCTENPNAWNVVAAYVTYSSQRKQIIKILTKLKIKSKKQVNDEVKLKDVNESDLKWFLQQLSNLDGTMFVVATDASVINNQIIEEHRRIQANKIVEHIDKMHYDSMKDSLRELSSAVEGLSPQLYLQLMSQFTLINDIINRATLYYSQKHPFSLGSFKWQIDQKNTTKITFEDAFEKMAPVIMQSISLREPFIQLEEGNYKFMKKYLYSEDKVPEFLHKEYGFEKRTGGAFNVGNILLDDMSFVDSKTHFGVQIADLLASTTRRILRNEFLDNIGIAKLLGSLMLQNYKDKNSIQLISFIDTNITNEETGRNIEIIDKASKRII
jgi:hypothetical protein